MSFETEDDKVDMTEEFEARLNEWDEFAAALKNQSTLGQVLITASFIDNQLGLIISNYFVEGQAKKDLFKGPAAPLGTFSSKTNLAFAMGLIDEREYSSINAIRSVRNQFAHNITTTMWAHDMSDRLAPLCWAIGQDKLGNFDPEQVFYLASQRIVLQLINRAAHVRKSRLMRRQWPLERPDHDPDYDFY